MCTTHQAVVVLFTFFLLLCKNRDEHLLLLDVCVLSSIYARRHTYCNVDPIGLSQEEENEKLEGEKISIFQYFESIIYTEYSLTCVSFVAVALPKYGGRVERHSTPRLLDVCYSESKQRTHTHTLHLKNARHK